MMRSKLTVIGVLALIISLSLPATAAAEGEAPGQPVRLAGKIASIQGTTITVDTLAGESQLVKISDDTKFRSLGGEVQSADDLEIGMHVVVLGSQQGEIVFARILAVATRDQIDRFDRFRGEVTEVDPARQQFTVENREGGQQTFSTSEDTKYHARQGEFNSFDDLASGQHVAVISSTDDENLALRVLLLPDFDGDRPQLDIRVRGEVSILSEGGIVVDTEQGGRLAFQLIDRTKIKGAGEDGLQLGDKVLVAGFENEEGENVAVIVLVRPTFDRELGDRAPRNQFNEPAPETDVPGPR